MDRLKLGRLLQTYTKLASSTLLLFCVFALAARCHGQSNRVGQIINLWKSHYGCEDFLNDELAKIGKPAVKPLLGALTDSDSEVRVCAARALGVINDPLIVEPLISALQDPNSEVRRSVIVVLGKTRDPRAVGPLIEVMKDEGPLDQDSPRALAEIGEPAIESLIAALKDQNPRIRIGAAHALGWAGDPRAVPPLIATLQDQDGGVLYAAVSALGDSRDLRAVDPLIAALKTRSPDGISSTASGQIKGAMIAALGNIGDPRAIDPAISALNDPDVFVRYGAIHALGKIGPAAIAPLTFALRNPDQAVEQGAAQALASIGTPSIDPLVAALKDADAGVRKAAARALSEIGTPPAASPLLAALQERDLAVIAGAFSFFISRGDPHSEDALIEALDKYGDEVMAVTYLNCGNSNLIAAGRRWAENGGYQIRESFSGNYAQWGSSH